VLGLLQLRVAHSLLSTQRRTAQRRTAQRRTAQRRTAQRRTASVNSTRRGTLFGCSITCRQVKMCTCVISGQQGSHRASRRLQQHYHTVCNLFASRAHSA
jgi:hypothetical protein